MAVRIVVRPKGADNLKVLTFEDLAEAQAKIIQYTNEADPAEIPNFYRVILGATENDDVVLRKVKLDPNSLVTTSVIESGTLVDDV